MITVKMVKELKGYNLSGFGQDFLTCKKYDIVALEDAHANRIIQAGLAVSWTDAPVDAESGDTDPDDESGAVTTDPAASGAFTTESVGTDEEFFTLTPAMLTHMSEMGKDVLIPILKDYGVEVDKRNGLESMRKTLVASVRSSLPENIAQGGPSEVEDNLVRYFTEKFKVSLDKEKYKEDALTCLALDMSLILEQALASEDS